MGGQKNQGVVPRPTAINDAALRGAALAFSKPPAKSKPLINTYTGGENGALLAAAKVGRGLNASAAGSPVHLTNQITGGSSRSDSRLSLSPSQSGSKTGSSSTLGVPEDSPDRRPSPSNIAARLAAARYSPRPPIITASHTPTTMSGRATNERDMLPPVGSVGNVLAHLEHRDPTNQHSLKRRESLGTQSGLSVAQPAGKYTGITDETRIPPTVSLVKKFEQRSPASPPNTTIVSLNVGQSSPPLVRSPQPHRAFQLPPEPKDQTYTKPPVKPKPRPDQRIELSPSQYLDSANETEYFTTARKDPMKSPHIKQKPVRLAGLRTDSPPPKPLSHKGSPGQSRTTSEGIKRSTSIRRISTSVGSEQGPSSPASFKSAKEQQDEEEKVKPVVPPPRRSNTRKSEAAPIASGPRDIPSTPLRMPEKFSPPRRPASTTGTSPGSVYHNAYQRDSVKQITKHMTGESLSSAIMGAALASSRNASPAPVQPTTIEPLFPSRRHRHHSPFHRSPSPQKQSPPKSAGKLRTTMRKDHSSSSDEDEVEKYKKKGSRIMGMRGKKHPNKHHEGTRKRWRDQITERERKRYEGVWAANKGMHLPNSSSSPTRTPVDDGPALDVLNLVVQEIWMRSRLPTHVLEEVWDLVDSRAIGRLRRDEFVVGLWLVDQRLKGRKLPVKVSESVWTSARGVGIKVKVHG